MFSGDPRLGLFSDDEDGVLELIVFGDDSEEEEAENAAKRQRQIVVVAAAVYVAHCEDAMSVSRSPAFCRKRLDWDSHLQNYLREGDRSFRKFYRMSHASFLKLADLIRPHLQGNEKMAKLRTAGNDIISTEMTLHCVLRFLSGAPCDEIRDKIGMSDPHFYYTLYKGIDAILRVDDLSYHFPQTPQEIQEAVSGFTAISSFQAIDGCVACLDGMLLRIQTPAANETANVKSYFSGHYQDYGINVQAACDSESRFVYAALKAPGGTNDIVAYRKSTLPKYIESLPLGTYAIGDNAYICTEHLLTPFPGDQKANIDNHSYNFFLSQCRIRIEMAFGLLVSKWRIFRRPLQVRLKHVGRLFLCATRLHNYCINERLLHQEGEGAQPAPPAGEDNIVQPLNYVPATIQASSIPGNSMMRDRLVDKIKRENLRRPAYNMQRNIDNT